MTQAMNSASPAETFSTRIDEFELIEPGVCGLSAEFAAVAAAVTAAEAAPAGQ